MAPIQRQRRRGLHTVHQVSLQQFRKSVLRQSTVILRTTSGNLFQARGAAAAKERSPKDVFILTTSITAFRFKVASKFYYQLQQLCKYNLELDLNCNG